MNETNKYAALETAGGGEKFARAMESLAIDAGASRFAVFQLHGDGYANLADVIHNGGAVADAAFRNGASVESMLGSMRVARPPKLFGEAQLPGLDIDGFRFGVAAIARGRTSACVLYLGLAAPVDDQARLFDLMGDTQLLAVHALAALPEPTKRVSPFSERELDCLRFIAAGLTPKEISGRLGISVGTVRNHLERARLRCGLDSTIAVCSLAMREGWVTTPAAASS